MTPSAPDPAAAAASASSVRTRIEAWCRENGYTTGHYGSCGHGDGLPHIDAVRIRPEWSPIDGDHVILVGAAAVIQAVCPYPWGDHDWQIRGRWSYADTDELKSILERLVRRPQGCWA